MSQESSQSAHRVVAIVDDGSNPFEIGVATELFGLRRPELEGRLRSPWYEFRLCSATPTVSMHAGFFTISGIAPLEAVEEADTVLVPNRPDPEVSPSGPVLDAVRTAASRGARLMSFCTGAFTLAEAGVLDGRRATTHWRWADLFRSRFPRVDLDPDVLYIDEGSVLTAAGSAAALDLGLHIIRNDHGADVANMVSRRAVFAGHRDGGQRQFVERPVARRAEAGLAPVLEWAQARLDRPLTVRDLARRASVSHATLHRRFAAELGTTPLGWLTGERVRLACLLLEKGELTLDQVAASSGLGTASNLRLLLRKHVGVNPTEYRRRFGHRQRQSTPLSAPSTSSSVHEAR